MFARRGYVESCGHMHVKYFKLHTHTAILNEVFGDDHGVVLGGAVERYENQMKQWNLRRNYAVHDTTYMCFLRHLLPHHLQGKSQKKYSERQAM